MGASLAEAPLLGIIEQLGIVELFCPEAHDFAVAGGILAADLRPRALGYDAWRLWYSG